MLKAYARRHWTRFRPFVWIASGVRHRVILDRRRRWRARFHEWMRTDVRPRLRSFEGEARMDAVVRELAQRLDRTLLKLDQGIAALDAQFVSVLQNACSWLAAQDDVLAHDATLRAYCDITASLAVLDRITTSIAAEFGLEPADVQLRLAAAAPSLP
jgi:hypothetical protein